MGSEMCIRDRNMVNRNMAQTDECFGWEYLQQSHVDEVTDALMLDETQEIPYVPVSDKPYPVRSKKEGSSRISLSGKSSATASPSKTSLKSTSLNGRFIPLRPGVLPPVFLILLFLLQETQTLPLTTLTRILQLRLTVALEIVFVQGVAQCFRGRDGLR